MPVVLTRNQGLACSDATYGAETLELVVEGRDQACIPPSSVLRAPLLSHRACSQLDEMVEKRRLDAPRRIVPEDIVCVVADVGGHPVLALVRCKKAPARDRTVDHQGSQDEARRR
jgi:hypothetical protein